MINKNHRFLCILLATSVARNPAEVQQMGKANILIVEDEFVVAEDLRYQLTKHGYEVAGIVGSGEEAIARIQNDPPDLVLMDILIKGKFDGFQAAKIIQSDYDVPVVFLTALSDPQLADVKPFDPCGYLAKPFTEDDLRDCIENALKYAPQ